MAPKLDGQRTLSLLTDGGSLGQRSLRTAGRRGSAWGGKLRSTLVLLITSFVWLSTLTAASALQVGAISSETGYAVAARTQMSEPGDFVHGTRDRAYYLATTFPDGWFFQAGYNDSANDYADGTYSNYCSTGFSWFVTGLLGNQSLGVIFTIPVTAA